MISLGFAALENVFYVQDGGVGVALARMFTAVRCMQLVEF